MTVELSPSDPRSVKALALLPAARRWVHGTRKSDGRAFLIAPASTPGAAYYVDARGADCTCPDRQARRATCKHMLAARLLLVERGERPSPAPTRATCRVCTQLLPVGVLSGVCAACEDVGLWVDGVAAIKAVFGAEHPHDVVRTIGT